MHIFPGRVSASGPDPRVRSDVVPGVVTLSGDGDGVRVGGDVTYPTKMRTSRRRRSLWRRMSPGNRACRVSDGALFPDGAGMREVDVERAEPTPTNRCRRSEVGSPRPPMIGAGPRMNFPSGQLGVGQALYGIFRVGRQDRDEVVESALGPLDVGRLHGVGRAVSQQLHEIAPCPGDRQQTGAPEGIFRRYLLALGLQQHAAARP